MPKGGALWAGTVESGSVGMFYVERRMLSEYLLWYSYTEPIIVAISHQALVKIDSPPLGMIEIEFVAKIRHTVVGISEACDLGIWIFPEE